MRRILTHPAAMAAKRPLRDLWWTLRGRTLRNPPIGGNVRAILFICKGNICRSPFAALRMTSLLHQVGVGGIRCVSAGFVAKPENRSPREAAEASARFGLSLAEHTPLPLSPELVGEFDLVVVMEAAHLDAFRDAYPEARAAVVLLPLLAAASGYDRYNIADPYGHDLATFERCYARIDRTLRALVLALRRARVS